MSISETRLPARRVGSALWQRLDEPALDRFHLDEFPGGHVLNGRVLAANGGNSIELHYAILCNRAWETQEAHVTLLAGDESQQLSVRRDAAGQWWRGDTALPELAGLADIDLSITPATNTLPIRRLALAVGESGAAHAAWLRVPELTLEPLAQRYTRMGEHSYLYQTGDGTFEAELEVDAAGIVVKYGALWERVAT